MKEEKGEREKSSGTCVWYCTMVLFVFPQTFLAVLLMNTCAPLRDRSSVRILPPCHGAASLRANDSFTTDYLLSIHESSRSVYSDIGNIVTFSGLRELIL